jgi:hypothetical protein
MRHTIKFLKRKAKKLCKEKKISHMQALHILAKENGFRSWGDLLANVS